MSAVAQAASAALAEAQASLSAARQHLVIAPAGSLEPIENELKAAEAALLRLAGACTPGCCQTTQLAEGLRELKASAQLLAALLEQAAAFRLGWARLWSALAGGYTAGGEPAPLALPPTLSVQG